LDIPYSPAPCRSVTPASLLSTPLSNAHTNNPFDDLVGRTPESSEYTNTALQLLSIKVAFFSTASISLPQICATFTGLRSLFLTDVLTTPEQTIVLPKLELLYVNHMLPRSQTMPVHAWDTPALRHVHLGELTTRAQYAAVLDGFLRRHAARLESLVLLHDSTRESVSLPYFPVDFWNAFPALRLLGIWEDWADWTIVPPTTHPLQYLVYWSSSPAVATVNRLRPRWTYHEGVKLVAVQYFTDSFYLVNSVRDEQWIATMERTNGILPEL